VCRTGGHPQGDVDRPGAGVTGGVRQRLLGDAVEAEGDLRRQRACGFAQAEPHREAVPPLDLRAVVAQGLGKAAAIEGRGVEVMAQAAQVLGQLRQAGADGVELATSGILLRQLPAYRLEIEGEGGEALAEVVVQLPRDPAPRLLLAGHSPTSHPAQLGAAGLHGLPTSGAILLRPLVAAHVEGTEEQARLGARHLETGDPQGDPQLPAAFVALALDQLAERLAAAGR
jgi:hypothetical protein